MQDPSVHRNNWIFPIQTNNHLLHLFWVETCYNAPTPTLTDNRKKSFHSIEHSLNFFKLHIYTHYSGRYYVIFPLFHLCVPMKHFNIKIQNSPKICHMLYVHVKIYARPKNLFPELFVSTYTFSLQLNLVLFNNRVITQECWWP